MTIPASGPVTFGMLQVEFGGSHPISLSEYYGNQNNVPVSVPSSGPISISDLRGKTATGGGGGYDPGDYPGGELP